MSRFVFDPPAQASIAVEGAEDRFPVRRIFCVGRNYSAHVAEMGGDEREPPFFFLKPADTVVDAGAETGATIPYPPETDNFHHEIELVVAIGAGGRNIPEDRVRDHIWGAATGVDLTRRDLQLAARDKGRPWDMGKGFDRSAPVAPLRRLGPETALDEGRIWLSVNGEIRQEADLSQMIWSVAEHVSILSRSVALAPGDLVMTGTPAGVGPIVAGDTVEGGAGDLPPIRITIGPRE